MSIHSSLHGADSLVGERSVLTRIEQKAGRVGRDLARAQPAKREWPQAVPEPVMEKGEVSDG